LFTTVCVFAGLAALIGAEKLLEWLISVYRRYRERSVPCVHGVPGAKSTLSLCPTCDAESKRRSMEWMLERQKEKDRKAAEELARYNQWVANIRLPEFIKKMDPEAFEGLVCRLFGRMGYRVESTPYVGDNGSDGYLYKGSEKIVLQCKRVQGSVGEPVLRDLFGTMHATQSTSGMVVTTGSVSRQARSWVEGKPIRIIECDELQELLREHFGEAAIVPPDFSVSGLASKPCPRCGKALRVIHGKRGDFIGCTGYMALPRCHYTSSIDENGLPTRRRFFRRSRHRRT
jgi:hypothetical protein